MYIYKYARVRTAARSRLCEKSWELGFQTLSEWFSCLSFKILSSSHIVQVQKFPLKLAECCDLTLMQSLRGLHRTLNV